MSRAFDALVRREIRRGKSMIIAVTVIAVVASVLTLVVGPDASGAIASIAAVAALVTPAGPMANLRTDRAKGYLEFDRALPVSHHVAARARLLGAAVRVAPALLLAVPVYVAVARAGDGTELVVIPSAIAIVAVLVIVTWLQMGINARWSLRRLWWLPATIVLGPRAVVGVLPASVRTAISAALAQALHHLAAALRTPAGVVMAVLLALLIPVLAFVGSARLFASGLEHYQFDAATTPYLAIKPPRRELAAAGRGPTLAVTRQAIRLATERPIRRLLGVAAFVVLIVLGNGEVRHMAQYYARTLALIFPASVALQLTSARSFGHLEGLQQLPHPARRIALGYLVALAVLSLPSTAIYAAVLLAAGQRVTWGGLVGLAFWFTTTFWIGSVAAVWLTWRRTVLALVCVAIAIGVAVSSGTVAHLARGAAAQISLKGAHVSVGIGVAALSFGLAVLIGMPLFAHGVREFEPTPRQGRLAQAFARIAEARRR